MSAATEQPATLRLLDEGLEMPDHLVGKQGVVELEKPDITMEATFDGPIPEISTATVFPTTGKSSPSVPDGHIRIDGDLYEIIDERELNECPHCGSDKVDATGDPPRCYTCDEYISEVA